MTQLHGKSAYSFVKCGNEISELGFLQMKKWERVIK